MTGKVFRFWNRWVKYAAPTAGSRRLLLWAISVFLLCAGCRGNQPTPTPIVVPVKDIGAPTVGISPTSDKFTPQPAPAESPVAIASLPAPLATRKPLEPGSPVPGLETSANNLQELDAALEAGAYWIRRNALTWSDVEPEEGARRWEVLAGLEADLARASQGGAQVVLIVRGTPGWAQKVSGSYCGPVKQEKFEAFSRFMADLVARYSVAPYNVKYWEIGNEPDVDPSLVPGDSLYGCWGDASDVYYGGGYYATMLQQVYPRVKQADPAAQVLVGGLLMDCDPINPPDGKNCIPSLFLEGILRQGGGDYFDGVSFHAYDYYSAPKQYANPNWDTSWNTTGPVVVAKSRYLRSVLNANGHPEKFLMNTEAGLICGRDGSEEVCQTEEFNRTKSAYVAQVNIVSLAEALRASIWYSLSGWRGTALVGPDFKPLPAYEAFRFSAAQLKGAVATRVITDYEGVSGYELLRDGQQTWFLFSVDGKAHKIQLPAAPLKVYDVYGAAVAPAQELKITAVPFYVQMK